MGPREALSLTGQREREQALDAAFARSVGIVAAKVQDFIHSAVNLNKFTVYCLTVDRNALS